MIMVVIDYTNHRGERGERTIEPFRLFHGTSEWHDGLQWFLSAWDFEKNALRVFAMKDIHSWRSA